MPSMHIRQALSQIISLGMIFTSALIIWKGLIVVTRSESPVVEALSGSMEPGIKRGDLLFLRMTKDPIRTGEIVVFHVDGREIPIVHRVITVHELQDTAEVDILTKGDSNFGGDLFLYADGQLWLQQHHIMGRVVGYLPYVGWVTIIMTEKPFIKYLLLGALGLLIITSKEYGAEVPIFESNRSCSGSSGKQCLLVAKRKWYRLALLGNHAVLPLFLFIFARVWAPDCVRPAQLKEVIAFFLSCF